MHTGAACKDTATAAAAAAAAGRSYDVTDRSYLADRVDQGNRATAGYFIRSSHWLNPAEVMQQAPLITAGNSTKWILITEIGKAINPGLQCFWEVTDRKPIGDCENSFLTYCVVPYKTILFPNFKLRLPFLQEYILMKKENIMRKRKDKTCKHNAKDVQRASTSAVLSSPHYRQPPQNV